jgi:pyruvate dehydrogenase E1 component alpha subunit
VDYFLSHNYCSEYLLMTPSDLIAFEADIAREFEAGHIQAPVHLSGGNEQQLIDIFREIKPTEWVCSTWRSHYHALLKGIPPAEVKRQIMAGRSMFISSPEHRFISSAIMGGMLPIACGLAYAGERVWVFVGDMCASIGAYSDALNFVIGRNLRVQFVQEDNGLSTNTPTEQAWGTCDFAYHGERYYKYARTYPHYQPLTGQHGF